MSSSSSLPCPRTEIQYCEALVVGIQGVAGPNNTSLKPTPVGTVQALMDPENRAGASFEMMGGNGSVRQVRVKRVPRGTDSETEDSISCNVTTDLTYSGQCIDVQLEANISFETTKEELQKYCADALTVVNGGDQPRMFREHLDMVMSKMNGLRENINRQVITKLLANVGNNITYDSTSPQTVTLIDSVTGAKVEIGIQELMYDLSNNEVYGTPIISGFGIFDRFNTSAQYGCCNSNGLNWDAMSSPNGPYKYYKDVKLGDISGDADYFFVFAPGMTQLVNYTDNIMSGLGLDGRHGNTRYGMIPDPFLPGMIYDVAIEETNCDGNGKRKPTWTVSIYSHFDVAITPAEAYSINDRLRTANGAFNGILLYKGAAL